MGCNTVVCRVQQYGLKTKHNLTDGTLKPLESRLWCPAYKDEQQWDKPIDFRALRVQNSQNMHVLKVWQCHIDAEAFFMQDGQEGILLQFQQARG